MRKITYTILFLLQFCMLPFVDSLAQGSTPNYAKSDNEFKKSPYSRGRIKIENGTLVTDVGTLLRGAFAANDSKWYKTPTREQVRKIKEFGLNCIHLYAESYWDDHQTGAGYNIALTDSLVKWTAQDSVYLMITFAGWDKTNIANLQFMKECWTKYAQRYKNETHLIFEIFNEPSATPYDSITFAMERDMYQIIRANAPETHILLMSPYNSFYPEFLDDIKKLDEFVDWSNASIAAHIYGKPAQDNIENIRKIKAAGYAYTNTEFHSFENKYANMAVSRVMEQEFTSYMHFIELSALVGDSKVFKNRVEASELRWNPDFGSWPQTITKINYQNPYNNIKAGFYDEGSGWRTDIFGSILAYINHESYVAYYNMDFQDGAGSFMANCSSDGTGGSIEIRLDSLNGPIVGVCPVTNTGSWDKTENFTCNLNTKVTGIHKVYLIFRRSNQKYAFDFRSFQFFKRSGEQPFTNSIFLPNIIEAENYLQGTNGTTYFDSDEGNTGKNYRFDDVDIEVSNDSTSSFSIGWTDAGEWLTYKVNCDSAQLMDLYVRVASIEAGEKLSISIDDEHLTNVEIPNTNGFYNWQTVKIENLSIPEGHNMILKVEMLESKFNLNWLGFTIAGEKPQFFNGAWELPCLIQAEDYDKGGQDTSYFDLTAGNRDSTCRNDDVDIERSAPDGYNVGWIEAGEWLQYTINKKESSYMNIDFRVACWETGEKMKIYLGEQELGTVYVPEIGGWQTWQNVSLDSVFVPAGVNQKLRIKMIDSSFNLNWFSFVETEITANGLSDATMLPATIEAEDYDIGSLNYSFFDIDSINHGKEYRSDAVDIEPCADSTGTYNVGWIEPNEWLEYTVSCKDTTLMNIHFRIASISEGDKFKLSLNSKELAVVSSSNTGHYQIWETVTIDSILIPKGNDQILRLDMLDEGFNLNWIRFEELEPRIAKKGRGRVKVKNGTVVTDKGTLLRGSFIATLWDKTLNEDELIYIKNHGLNAIHLYSECHSQHKPGELVTLVDSIVNMTERQGLYLILTIGACRNEYDQSFVNDFWSFYAPRYRNRTHVLFEIRNEPIIQKPPYPDSVIDMERNAYQHIRSLAPETHILFMSYYCPSNPQGAIQNICDLGDGIDWNNASISVHGYDDQVHSVETFCQTIMDSGYAVMATEPRSINYNFIDLASLRFFETKGISYLHFVQTEVLMATGNFKKQIESSEIRWTPDFGNWPASLTEIKYRNPYDIYNPFLYDEGYGFAYNYHGLEPIQGISNGDYIAFYNLNFQESPELLTGEFLNHNLSGGSAEIRLDSLNGPVVGNFEIPHTGMWKFDMITCELAQFSGIHNVYIVFTESEDDFYRFRLDRLMFTKKDAKDEPFSGNPHQLPCKIEAENFNRGDNSISYYDNTLGNSGFAYRNNHVDIQLIEGKDDEYNVGWIDEGEWLEYTINNEEESLMNVQFRIASIKAGESIKLFLNDKEIAKITIPNTGDWQKWQIIQIDSLIIPEGDNQSLKLYFMSNSFNLDWFNFIKLGKNTDSKSTSFKTISIFPNPANQTIYINGWHAQNENINYKLLDVTGKIVKQGKTANRSINVVDIKSGIYILSLNIDHTVFTKKIIVE